MEIAAQSPLEGMTTRRRRCIVRKRVDVSETNYTILTFARGLVLGAVCVGRRIFTRFRTVVAIRLLALGHFLIVLLETSVENREEAAEYVSTCVRFCRSASMKSATLIHKTLWRRQHSMRKDKGMGSMGQGALLTLGNSAISRVRDREAR